MPINFNPLWSNPIIAANITEISENEVMER